MSAYLSARESADYCGVSEKTIRNWIASGRLSAEKSAGAFRIAQEDLDALRPGGPHRQQGAESASAEVRAEGSAEGSAVVAGLAGLVTLVDRLAVENRQLAEAAAMWQARAQMLDERVRALEAPKPEPAPDPFPEPIPPAPTAAPWDARWQMRATIAATVLAVLALAATLAPVWAR